MKNKSSKRGLSYFFRQRIHGKHTDNLLVLEKSKTVLENILRWEDDGGQMLDARNQIDESNLDMVREPANE